ncbi:MAG: amino acid permease [Pseudomonadota bacterium]
MQRYGFSTAIAIIIANMIGTGVFTSLGFQLIDIKSGFAIAALWTIGGIIALCGALCYAELGAAIPRSGGEYTFLTRCYHPAAGFISGFVSATVGFAAPIALAAMTFAAYGTSVFGDTVPDAVRPALACLLVLLMAVAHSGKRGASGATQLLFTILKLGVIIAFCVAAPTLADALQPVRFQPVPADATVLLSGAFAVSLIYVNYAFQGWNAATYISAELETPQKTVPLVLTIGALVVATLYVALNVVFLLVAPVDALTGEIEVGFIAAEYAFGPTLAKATGLVMAALLISTVSAMTIAGPRVLHAMGEDFRAFRVLGAVNDDGIPARAIYLQALIACAFILTSSFETVLLFAGFTLSLNTFFAVLGLLVLRVREPGLERPFRATLYPAPMIIFLVLMGWTLVFTAIQRPAEIRFAGAVIIVGLIGYLVSGRRPRDSD